MTFTEAEVLEFIEENGVRFVRLVFCDLFGESKNIAIGAGELPEAFRRGVCVDTSAVEGFVGGEENDIFLFPDPSTLSVLPWRPSQGGEVQLYCDIRRFDGKPYSGDGRSMLRAASEKAAARGLVCNIGPEFEFYLFELDETGNPTRIPHDAAGYCDIAPRDRGEGIRREICLALDDMGLHPESSHHERGPGQSEIVCRYATALEAGDKVLSFRAVSEIIAARSGLHACFLPKPLPDRDGNAMHLNLSLSRDGVNLFKGDGEHNAEAEQFMAGVLHHLPSLTAFLNPLPTSYLRLGDDVPDRLTWAPQNRLQLVRIPAAVAGENRMELRSPDSSLSPYLCFALLLEAGLWGIENGIPLQRDIPEAEAPLLPQSLEEALRLAEASELVRQVLPERALRKYLDTKQAQYDRWAAGEDA